MFCEHECYLIGGPWIAENPSCPKHGSGSLDRTSAIHGVLVRVWNREISADEGFDEIEFLM